MALKRIPATLIQRIRHARSVMGEAEQGYLAVRAAAAEADELGFLEKSFNRMLEEIGTTISSVQREADEVAALPKSWRPLRRSSTRPPSPSHRRHNDWPATSAISGAWPTGRAAKAPRRPIRPSHSACVPS